MLILADEYTVRVTAEDIKKGQSWVKRHKNTLDQRLTRNCAVSLAFQRTFGDPHADWRFSCGDARGKTFMAVRADYLDKWVEKHDALKEVKPFNFKVRVLSN